MQSVLVCILLLSAVSAQSGNGTVTIETPSGSSGSTSTVTIETPSGSSGSTSTVTIETLSGSSGSTSTVTIETPSGSSGSTSTDTIPTDITPDISGTPVFDYQRCIPVYELIADGCFRGCIEFNFTAHCPICNTTCNDEGGLEVEDECQRNEDCTPEEICLAKGIGGLLECLPKLTEGERCDIEPEVDLGLSSVGYMEEDMEVLPGEFVNMLPGAKDRFALGSISQALIPCRDGLVCGRDGLTRKVCRQENVNGTCVRARASDSTLACDEDGNFKALQCETMNSGRRTYRCRCVDPENTQDSEYVDVKHLSQAPDCDDIVFDRCSYEVSGRSYSVRHDATFINLENCTRCLCQNGEPAFCRELPSCHRINPDSTQLSPCTDIPGSPMEHGARRNIDCNRCKCFNGTTKCTHNDCDMGDSLDRETTPTETEDVPRSNHDLACMSCKREERKMPVCGKDGRTYRSACFAVNCTGLDINDTMPGRCSNYDVCQQYPCESGEMCVPKGRVTCLSRRGCWPNQMRTCISPDNLYCDNRRVPGNSTDEVEESDTSVCGINRRNYHSLCAMLQETGSGQVAYAGQCNRTECLGGKVCGTDGTTYNNICELRGQSANARVDYRGDCLRAENETTLDELCRDKKRRRECNVNDDNCQFMIQPSDGCCPVCGGVVSVAMDREGLDEYIKLNPSISDLDDLIGSAVATGFIPKATLDRCNVSSSLLDTGDLQIVLESNQTNQQYCNSAAEVLAVNIDDPIVNSVTEVPQAFQFAMAAVSSPPIVQAFSSGSIPNAVLSSVLMLVALMSATLG